VQPPRRPGRVARCPNIATLTPVLVRDAAHLDRAYATLSIALAALFPLITLGACRPISGTDDPQTLGYGPHPQVAAAMAAGYSPDPNPRPAPTAWEPPPRSGPTTPQPQIDPDRIRHAPEIIALCQHLGAIPGASPHDAGSNSSYRAELRCRAGLRIDLVFRRPDAWRELATCLHEADTGEAVQACREHNALLLSPVDGEPEASQACMHIMALATVDRLGEDQPVDIESIETFQTILDDCVVGLLEDVGPGERGPKLACINAAQSSTAIQSCD